MGLGVSILALATGSLLAAMVTYAGGDAQYAAIRKALDAASGHTKGKPEGVSAVVALQQDSDGTCIWYVRPDAGSHPPELDFKLIFFSWEHALEYLIFLNRPAAQRFARGQNTVWTSKAAGDMCQSLGLPRNDGVRMLEGAGIFDADQLLDPRTCTQLQDPLRFPHGLASTHRQGLRTLFRSPIDGIVIMELFHRARGGGGGSAEGGAKSSLALRTGYLDFIEIDLEGNRGAWQMSSPPAGRCWADQPEIKEMKQLLVAAGGRT